MKKHSLIYFQFIIINVFAFQVKAQIREQSLRYQDPISVPSPNVASLGIFGEIPVSYFTGIPNIEVPIYTFSEGKVIIPISLNYHASGFRPDMHPGWAGAGWALTAGGVISRTVNGKPDDFDTYENEQTSGHIYSLEPYGSRSGYYFNRVYLDSNRWNQVSYLRELTGNDVDIRIIGTRKDTEPDEFNFSFPGGNGKFYLNMDGSWRVSCDRAVKVEFNGQFLAVPFNPVPGSLLDGFGYYKTFSGFTITDIDGMKYVYGGNTNFIEYSNDFIDQDKGLWQADSWYLKSIIEPSGKQINLEYERDTYINQLIMSLNEDFGSGPGGSGFWIPPCGLSETSFQEEYLGRLISPIYLTRISGQTGSISFKRSPSADLKPALDYFTSDAPGVIARDIYSIIFYKFLNNRKNDFFKEIFPILRQDEIDKDGFTNPPDPSPRSLSYALWYARRLQWYRLDSINIFSSDGTKLKFFEFKYASNVNKRLSLTSITESAPNGLHHNPYLFFYNPLDADVPYFSGKLDHWEFYNGILSDVNELYDNPMRYYNSRSPNFYFSKMTMLNKIIYPTSGSVEFEYESNFAGKQVGLDRSADLSNFDEAVGGIRIRKIKSIIPDNLSETMEKEYLYVNNYSPTSNVNMLKSSGILGGQSLYLFKNFKVPVNDGSAYMLKNQFNSLSHLPTSNNSLGSHIGYSTVVEKRSDNSFSIFYFTNFDNGHKDEFSPTINPMISPYEPFTSLENERGKLFKLEQYNSASKLIFKKETAYAPINKNSEYIPSIRARSYAICPGTNDRYFEGNAYKHYTYAYLPVKEIDSNYYLDGSKPISITKEYVYSQNKLIKTQTVVGSDLKTRMTKNYYPFDFTTFPYTEMTQKNQISNLIKKEDYLNGVLLTTSFTGYSKSLDPNGTLILPSYSTSQYKNDPPEERMRFYKYDNRGNPLSVSINNGPVTNYLWGYAKNYLIAEVKNVEYNKIEEVLGATYIETVSNYIKTAGGLTPIFEDNDFFPQLRDDARMAASQITTYKYFPLIGLRYITDPKGYTTYYEYDPLFRLSDIKDREEKIVQKFNYNYGSIKFYNKSIGQLFTKSSYSSGLSGSTILYNVPAGKYSAGSQQEADALAQADVLSNGQAYANSVGQSFRIINVGYAATREEIRSSTTSQPYPSLRAITLYSLVNLGPQPISKDGIPESLFYINQKLTDIAPDGFYTLNETDPSHIGFKFYYLRNGKFMFENWGDQQNPVINSPSN